MSIIIINITIITPDKVISGGHVEVDGDRITAVGKGKGKAGAGVTVVDGKGGFLVPGFIDFHCHGGAGYDLTSGLYDPLVEGFKFDDKIRDEAPVAICKAHAIHGTTTLLLGTLAAPIENIKAALAGLAKHLGVVPGGGRLEGAFCEGTFLKEQAFAGAQSDRFFKAPDVKLFDELNESANGSIRIVTIAPEYGESAVKLVKHLSGKGVVPAIGHSAARYKDTMAAIDAGLRLATHFSNGPIFTTFKPPGGAMEAVMERPEVVLELICDGYHINPRYVMDFLSARKLEAVLITDAMPPVGSPDIKSFVIGDKRGVLSEDGGVMRLAGTEFTLFGSVLTMDRAVANVTKWLMANKPGVYTAPMFKKAPDLKTALSYAVKMATVIPAKVLGLDDRGRIEKGKLADLVLMDKDLAVKKVFVGGREI